jgi:3-deoxy-manno-octulosonate cytidylyltransferase (CMP-KDO synthetase)
MMNILGIIPARYASTRFPGKMLADIAGKTMVQRVYEQASQATSLTKVIVATDNDLIFNHIRDIGGEVVMTRPEHPSGTDRCFEALQQTAGTFDFVVNIQGDEPFIAPEQIDTLTSVLTPDTELATLIKTIDDYRTLTDIGEAHVVINTRQEAIYFSRSIIPFVRGEAMENWLSKHTFYKHVGLYAYRSDILTAITKLPVSALEQAESLEQLRWIENGHRIRVAFTDLESVCIETPEDLERAVAEFGI